MKNRISTVAILVMMAALFTHNAWGSLAEPVSPGATEGRAVTAQACPAFSWSSSAGAVGYTLEVYELATEDAVSREQMRQTALPVISKEISAPAFSWTPASGECLQNGMKYVWYVRSIVADDRAELAGRWSEGRVFEVDIMAETQVMDAVRETVESYLTDDWTKTDSYTQVKEEIKKEIAGNADRSAQGTIGTMAFEGSSNTLYGQLAGTSLGDDNDRATFIGYGAGLSTNEGVISYFGKDNTFVGYYAGALNSTGYSNTFIGSAAGLSNTTGVGNTFVGYSSGYNTTGAGNTFVGESAGYNATGSGNVFIGYEAGYSETGSAKLRIENSLYYPPLIYGEFNNHILQINGTLIMASDERLKENIEPLSSSLDKVMHLKGVSYKWKDSKGGTRGFGSEKEIGLLAQNVESVLPELVHTDNKGYKAVAYDKMVAVLIEAVKEQQAQLKEKEARIERLEKERASITAMLKELSDRIAAAEDTERDVALK